MNVDFSKHLELDSGVLKIKDEIEALDLNQITPIQALSILNDFKEKYNK